MKKVIILLALLALCLTTFSCGGGGAGSADVPTGENPGLPSVVQLLPSHNIAQIFAIITLHTKVLDGNGIPVPNTPVRFTNLSPIGVLSSTSANTDSSGLATVTLSSTTTGFSTVQAEVNTGVAIVRDRKTVYFSTNNVLKVTMSLDVDSVPGNGNDDTFVGYDESSDYILFDPPPDPDNTVAVLATVRNAGGVRVAGESVLWSSDHTEATFLRTETVTNINGQAKAVVKVTPESIRDTETHVNIMAYAGNGAANMVTLFLQRVIVDPTASYLTANPTVVEPDGTSTITAVVKLNTGCPTPDGTVVNFTTCDVATCTTTCGTVDPFGLTTDGVTTAIFTAPSTPGNCTITGEVAGVTIGTVDVIVTTALTVQPGTTSVNGATGGTATFRIFGGVPNYTITSSSTTILPVPATVTASPWTFTVTVPAGTPSGSVTLTVRDSAGTTKDVTLTIAAAPAITVVPGSYSVTAGVAVGRVFTITGGAPPYIINSSNPSAVYDSGAGDGVWNVVASGGTFTANVSATACPGTITLTIYDSAGGSKTATIIIVGSPIPIVVTTTSPTICENTANCGGSGAPTTAIFTITGGLPPYFTTSSDSAVILSPGATNPFTVDAIPNSITANTTITFTISDSCAVSKTATVTVLNEP